MKKRNKEVTRKQILDTALEKFAEKGFDAASISQIAKAADINQALIYYYFENKQAMLDELLDTFINTANGFLVDIATNGYAYGSPEMMQQMEKYNAHIIRNEKTLRLLLTESMKDRYETPPIFRMIDFGADGLNEQQVMQQMNERGFNFDQDDQQRKVTEFFTGIMPMVVFSLFKDKWGKHFGVTQQELFQLFTRAEEMTHSTHHEDEA